MSEFATPEDYARMEREGVIPHVAPGPIDWPARLRAAAEVARGYGWGDLPRALETMAAAGSSEEVEAIGRALLGETS
jgi:hypothetical protein